MPRKHYEWKLRDQTLQLGERTLVMGILNVTPDSFSDGGKYADPDRAFARALELEEQGADIIDIGAESTRPGSARISEAEELRRLVPVLKRLQNRLHIPISVDTYKSAIAAKALDLGAAIINDPSGLTWDPGLARAVVGASAGLVLNHMRGTPETWTKLPPLKDPLSTIALDLDSAMHRAVRAGLHRKSIVIDPGLGFGKRKEQNAEILAGLDQLATIDLPLLVGASRKHFLAKESAGETEFASAAAVTAAILYGAHIVRVHDVKAMRAVAGVADEIARVRSEREEAEREAKAARAEQQKKRDAARALGPRLPLTRREDFFPAARETAAVPVRPTLQPRPARIDGARESVPAPGNLPLESGSPRLAEIAAQLEPLVETGFPDTVIAASALETTSSAPETAPAAERTGRNRPIYLPVKPFGKKPFGAGKKSFGGKKAFGGGKSFGEKTPFRGKGVEGKFRGKPAGDRKRWNRDVPNRAPESGRPEPQPRATGSFDRRGPRHSGKPRRPRKG